MLWRKKWNGDRSLSHSPSALTLHLWGTELLPSGHLLLAGLQSSCSACVLCWETGHLTGGWGSHQVQPEVIFFVLYREARPGWDTKPKKWCAAFYSTRHLEAFQDSLNAIKHLRAQVFPSFSMFLRAKEQCKAGFRPRNCHNSLAAPSESTDISFPCFPWAPTAS